MVLTRSQAIAKLARIQKCVIKMWIFFGYKGRPRDLTPNNLDKSGEILVDALKELDRHAELEPLLPSINAVQAALKKTIQEMNFAKDTFEFSSFIERREYFYQAYRSIYERISQTKECLEALGTPVEMKLAILSSSTQQLRAIDEFTHLNEYLDYIWHVFRYDHRGSYEVRQSHLLQFEEEIRKILEKIAISQDLKDLLWSADKMQAGLRETVLQLNFAVDILGLPLTPERSKQFRKVHEAISDNLSLIRISLRSKE